MTIVHFRLFQRKSDLAIWGVNHTDPNHTDPKSVLAI